MARAPPPDAPTLLSTHFIAACRSEVDSILATASEAIYRLTGHMSAMGAMGPSGSDIDPEAATQGIYTAERSFIEVLESHAKQAKGRRQDGSHPAKHKGMSHNLELDDLPGLDAKTFQEPLAKLAEAIAQKVSREGPQQVRPRFVTDDLFLMIRHSLATYHLLLYLNADERRENDCYWNIKHGVVAAPLIRSMIDCLYNITAILQDPLEKGAAYRKSGLKKRLADIEEDQETYGQRPGWDEYIKHQLGALDTLARGSGYTEQEIRDARSWPTLGQYLVRGKQSTLTPHQQFLKKFEHTQWRQYSAMSHGGFEGYIGELPVAAYYTTDCFPHEQRPMIESSYSAFLTRHVGRAAAVLLCIATEIQVYFRFEGADINKRLVAMWAALMPLFEAKELYDARYSELMKERGILSEG